MVCGSLKDGRMAPALSVHRRQPTRNVENMGDVFVQSELEEDKTGTEEGQRPAGHHDKGGHKVKHCNHNTTHTSLEKNSLSSTVHSRHCVYTPGFTWVHFTARMKLRETRNQTPTRRCLNNSYPWCLSALSPGGKEERRRSECQSHTGTWEKWQKNNKKNTKTTIKARQISYTHKYQSLGREQRNFLHIRLQNLQNICQHLQLVAGCCRNVFNVESAVISLLWRCNFLNFSCKTSVPALIMCCCNLDFL